ncbi:MAG: hypothetical protein AAF550_06875 [Myxococcota bacterium]
MRCAGTSWLAFGLLVSMASCDEPAQVGPAIAPSRAAEAPPPEPDDAAEADAGFTALGYRDEHFVELDVQNRDPFRGYARVFKVRPSGSVQRRVTMPSVAIDEMSLIAIVSGSDQPRAMLVDPQGVGHVVKRGEYIGRAEIVQTGGEDAMPVTLNWRVDRIRPAEVVLTRDDPTAPSRPPLTRVVPLYEEGELLEAPKQTLSSRR